MFCSHCGQELEKDALYCPECGAKVGDDAKAPDPSAEGGKEHKRKNFFLAVGIVIGMIIIGTAVFLFLNNGKDNGAEKPDKQGIEKEEKIDESEYIFPHSDKEYLTDADVEKLTEEELGFARNEIIARHGRIFTDEKYKPYFEEKSWYKGTVEPEVFDADYENQLNEIEKANVEIIKKYEGKFKVYAIAGQYYASVLKEYQEAEAGGYSGSADQYPQVNPLLFGYGCPEPLYFTLVDLCGDGMPELLIGYFPDGDSEDYILMELYGYEDESAKQLAVSMEFGVTPLGEQNFIGERTRYYICDNGLIKENGSGGAAVNNVTYYELWENSVEMSVKEGAGQDGESYFEVDGGGLGATETTKAFYEEMQDKYPLKSDVEWYKLQELEISVQEEEAADEEEAYEGILQQYRNQKGMLMTGGDVDLNQNGIDDFTENNPDLNRNVFGGTGELPAGLSYAMTDIDGNGVRELFIADVAEEDAASYTTYDIYTCVQGTPQKLFDTADMGIQSFYFICENNVIMKIQKENDSTWYGYLFYRVVGDSASPEFADGVWIYPGSSLGSMYSRSEECMDENAESVDEAFYHTLMDTYPVRTDINWIKL